MVSVQEGVCGFINILFYTCMEKIVEITRRDGGIMKIAQSYFKSAEKPTDFTFQVLTDDETNWWFVTDDGLEASIPKEIIEINHLKVVGGKVTLSESLYQHWFGDAINRKRQAVPLLDCEHLDWILRHPELVLDNPSYFLLK